MTIGGFANHVARINLTDRTVTYEEIPHDWAMKYIGARGLGVRYLLEGDPTCDPLGPDNLLCIMNGPVTGSRVNMSGRQALVTKSPLTGTVTDSHIGGWSAARMRWAGFDALIIEGKADSPVYLYLQDGTVEIRDASEVWGKNVHDTIDFFKDRYEEKNDLSVMTIGTAGENMVKYAAWINEDDRAAGRGGTGAVGGSKNLKAVVMKAKQDYTKPLDDFADEFDEARKGGLNAIIGEGAFTQPRKGGLSVYGTNVLTNITNTIGAYPTRNGQTTTFAPDHETLTAEWVNDNILVAEPTCHACPVACKKEVEVEYNGRLLRTESVEYESAWALGGFAGNNNTASVAWMIAQCNDYGLDTIEMGGALSCYAEICQEGLNGDFEALEWGDHEQMVALVEKTAARDGVGDIIAEAASGIAEHFGRPDLAMSVRGQVIPAYDPRGLKGMGLGYATSNRGACHLRAYTPASELGVIDLKTDPLDWESKPELVKLLQDLSAFTDSMDLCKFSQFVESPDNYADQYRTLVGLESFTPDDLLEAGERIYNLERYYNILAGETEGADTLPSRFTDEPSTAEGSEGHVCELDQMLEAYYELRGWNKGLIPEEKLRELAIID
ncbi:MAG: aldehyde ferredoxin oxidoreductase family protein [Chloroflexi bacterium]|nr:aldehyde ferredoxin oxidoreductase family protein [Chloroflexota bacterium]